MQGCPKRFAVIIVVVAPAASAFYVDVCLYFVCARVYKSVLLLPVIAVFDIEVARNPVASSVCHFPLYTVDLPSKAISL